MSPKVLSHTSSLRWANPRSAGICTNRVAACSVTVVAELIAEGDARFQNRRSSGSCNGSLITATVDIWAKLMPDRTDQARDLVVRMVLVASISKCWTLVYTRDSDKISSNACRVVLSVSGLARPSLGGSRGVGGRLLRPFSEFRSRSALGSERVSPRSSMSSGESSRCCRRDAKSESRSSCCSICSCSDEAPS
jgi:hypothetical protein